MFGFCWGLGSIEGRVKKKGKGKGKHMLGNKVGGIAMKLGEIEMLLN